MEKKDVMKVSFNVPRKEYETYKQNLVKMRRTPTSDLVGHIRDLNAQALKKQSQED
jgi:hypothetical protein